MEDPGGPTQSLEEKVLQSVPLSQATVPSPSTRGDGGIPNGTETSASESTEHYLHYEQVKHSHTHPKFLHSNSTSHIWPFGAIAELIDNAVDPDVRATEFCIDMDMGDAPKLFFTDNGIGMTAPKLHKMLSFGYCEKVEVDGIKPIGHYGNGFKSGSMRLGKDALVLTKTVGSLCAGLLSQTFLQTINAVDVLVPIVSWDKDRKLASKDSPGVPESLMAILRYSPYKTEEELFEEMDKIPDPTGTRIIIFNLRKEKVGESQVEQYEFVIDEERNDILIRPDVLQGKEIRFQRNRGSDGIDIPLDYSLRAFCSVLYLKPRMLIFILGKKVRTRLIQHSLSQTWVDTYKPFGWNEPVKITLGFNAEDKRVYGMMLYHRNRLIMPYVRVGMQLSAGYKGVGVIGVIEADFLQPTHNKMGFFENAAYRNCLAALADRLSTYWWEHKHRQEKTGPTAVGQETAVAEQTQTEVPDELWVQCDACLKWRKLGSHVKKEDLPDKWYCRMNTDDPAHANCSVEQESENQETKPQLKEIRKKKLRIQKEKALGKQKQKEKEQEEKLAAWRAEQEKQRAKEAKQALAYQEQMRLIAIREQQLKEREQALILERQKRAAAILNASQATPSEPSAPLKPPSSSPSLKQVNKPPPSSPAHSLPSAPSASIATATAVTPTPISIPKPTTVSASPLPSPAAPKLTPQPTTTTTKSSVPISTNSAIDTVTQMSIDAPEEEEEDSEDYRRREIEEWLRNEEIALREKRLAQEQTTHTTTTTTTTTQQQPPLKRRRVGEEEEEEEEEKEKEETHHHPKIKTEPLDGSSDSNDATLSTPMSTATASLATPNRSVKVSLPPMPTLSSSPSPSLSSSPSPMASNNNNNNNNNNNTMGMARQVPMGLPPIGREGGMGGRDDGGANRLLLDSVCAKVSSLLRTLVPPEYFAGRQGVLTPEEIISLPEGHFINAVNRYARRDMPQTGGANAVELDKLRQRSKELDHLREKIVALLALLVQQSDLGINDEGRIDRLFCLWVDRELKRKREV